MSPNKTRLSSPLFAVFAVLALIAAACRPTSRAVVTQSPVSSPVPTRALASPTAPVATRAATAAATTAPTQSAARPTPTAQPAAAETAVASPAPATPSATEISRQPVPVPLGEALRAGDLQIAALKIEKQGAIGSVQPPDGHHFELVTVKVTNLSAADPVKFLPEMFVLYDTAHARSFVMDLAHDVLGAPDVLSSADLQPGASLIGVIVYEVPDGSADWQLKYQTNADHLLWSLSG
ncbi:MAG: DUF4352 domain-containing protein [Anaerolineales bacterium]|nr:DUF4352 domain-containing protein [Anaerolineales bacterium]